MPFLFLADYFTDQINGGGENNDARLIAHLRDNGVEVTCIPTTQVTQGNIDEHIKVIVGNFVRLPEALKQHLIHTKSYLIYEHDHKYVATRDPAKFVNFNVPADQIVNRQFYEASAQTIVLSDICQRVLKTVLPAVKVHSIGCSLWTEDFFELMKDLCTVEKTKDTCILLSHNPTKNYPTTVKYCLTQGIDYTAIHAEHHSDFLEQMAEYKNFLFMPTVLETFSRVCAEAKMLGLNVLTNPKMVGMFSESFSHLKGPELQEALYQQNERALKHFLDWVKE